MISVKYDLLALIHWVKTKLSEKAEWTMLCDWVGIKSLFDKATSGTRITQTQSLSESEQTHAKVDLWTTQTIQLNDKQGMRDCCDQNEQ